MKKLKIFLCSSAFLVVILLYNSTNEHENRNLQGLPSSSMTRTQIREGGEILYSVGIIYILFCIRELCTNHFMPVIDFIVNKYEISPDIAGATLMALGGSAPEIFISFMGTFVADNTIGFATIIGSGAFNAMLLVGICAMYADSILDLQ